MRHEVTAHSESDSGGKSLRIPTNAPDLDIFDHRGEGPSAPRELRKLPRARGAQPRTGIVRLCTLVGDVTLPLNTSECRAEAKPGYYARLRIVVRGQLHMIWLRSGKRLSVQMTRTANIMTPRIASGARRRRMTDYKRLLPTPKPRFTGSTTYDPEFRWMWPRDPRGQSRTAFDCRGPQACRHRRQDRCCQATKGQCTNRHRRSRLQNLH